MLRSSSILALLLLVALLLTSGCGGSERTKEDEAKNSTSGAIGGDNRDERETPEAARTGLRPQVGAEAGPVWFEVLLTGRTVPKVATSMRTLPGLDKFMILGRNGDLYVYPFRFESVPLAEPGSKIAKHGHFSTGSFDLVKAKIPDVAGRKDIGSIAMELDPGFEENRLFYVWYCDGPDKFVCLDRFRFDDDPGKLIASRTNIIKIDRRDPPKPYHMGGIVKFLPDKTLLIAIGDSERPELSQDKQDLNGKLIRIQPNYGAEGGYSVPSDNPHVGDAAYRPEIVAMGLRAPFRGFLYKGATLVFGDVGATNEEINVYRGGAVDFGWDTGPQRTAQMCCPASRRPFSGGTSMRSTAQRTRSTVARRGSLPQPEWSTITTRIATGASSTTASSSTTCSAGGFEPAYSRRR